MCFHFWSSTIGFYIDQIHYNYEKLCYNKITQCIITTVIYTKSKIIEKALQKCII